MYFLPRWIQTSLMYFWLTEEEDIWTTGPSRLKTVSVFRERVRAMVARRRRREVKLVIFRGGGVWGVIGWRGNVGLQEEGSYLKRQSMKLILGLEVCC